MGDPVVLTIALVVHSVGFVAFRIELEGGLSNSPELVGCTTWEA